MFGYIINFFVWWYLVKAKEYFVEEVFGGFIFQMNLTRTLPMVRNFKVPLFRDNSSFGKSISMIIKFWWIGFGTIVSLVKSIPHFLIFLIIIVLPIIPFIQLALYISRII